VGMGWQPSWTSRQAKSNQELLVGSEEAGETFPAGHPGHPGWPPFLEISRVGFAW
jgi:hypothetical protein